MLRNRAQLLVCIVPVTTSVASRSVQCVHSWASCTRLALPSDGGCGVSAVSCMQVLAHALSHGVILCKRANSKAWLYMVLACAASFQLCQQIDTGLQRRWFSKGQVTWPKPSSVPADWMLWPHGSVPHMASVRLACMQVWV
jgi:hypothetical protein